MKHGNLTLEVVGDGATDRAPEPPLHMLRRVFRGRWGMVIPLAAALGLLCSFVGYKAVPPQYKSTALVRVESASPSILYDSPENHAPPLFDAYVASLATELQSRQIADAAVMTPQMRTTGWPDGPQGVAELQRALAVRRGRGEQIIHVSVTHADPVMAQTAVNAVLTSFEKRWTEPGGLSTPVKIEMLAERERHLQQQLNELRAEILESSDQYGLEAFAELHENRIDELIAMDDKLAEIRLARARLDAGDGIDPGETAGLTARGGKSPSTSALAEQELALVAEIESLRSEYGAKHPMIRELNRKLEALRIRMDLREHALPSGAFDSRTALAGGEAQQQAAIRQLDEMENRYGEMRDELREQAERLGRTRVLLASLDERAEECRKRLADTRSRLDELQLEANRDTTGRVTIAAYGDRPVAPEVDRRSGVAAAGALFGAMLGAGIVFLLGWWDPRLRFVEELEALDAPVDVVTMLPDLDAGDGASEARAARSVHQLRNLLELQCGDPNDNIHAVTSCERGEGKTSLALALGASFAAAGRKTLLIDADVTAAGLTQELDLSHATGLCEAIGPDDQTAKVHQTRQPNLWAMPIGSTEGLEPEDLSRARLAELLHTVRNRFDAIVIDTGPILSSVEAVLVSALSDRVVTVVERFRSRRLVEASLARLEQIGANCAGMVFNRAASVDFKNRDASTDRTSARIASLIPDAIERAAPLAQAVARRGSAPDRTDAFAGKKAA